MPTTRNLVLPTIAVPQALVSLLDEAAVFLSALIQPGQVIAEVQASRALFDRAARIEARDPQRAAVLRREGARIGLR